MGGLALVAISPQNDRPQEIRQTARLRRERASCTSASRRPFRMSPRLRIDRPQTPASPWECKRRQRLRPYDRCSSFAVVRHWTGQALATTPKAAVTNPPTNGETRTRTGHHDFQLCGRCPRTGPESCKEGDSGIPRSSRRTRVATEAGSPGAGAGRTVPDRELRRLHQPARGRLARRPAGSVGMRPRGRAPLPPRAARDRARRTRMPPRRQRTRGRCSRSAESCRSGRARRRRCRGTDSRRWQSPAR